VRKTSRLALVIGNSHYKTAPLKNPVNDAADMAATLKKYGFSVIVLLDASRKKMKKAVRAFGKDLRKNSGVGLFYYAGHGMQIKGNNYLIPTGVTIESEADVEDEAVSARLILGKMEDAGNDLNIVILDACRNNPYSRNFRTSTPGLARMDAPKGTLISYATGPGSVAADGDGRNGLYTQHLLKNMGKPGLKIEDVLKNVRIAVVSETTGKQIPWEASSLMGDFYFIAGGTPPEKIQGTNLSENRGKLNIDSEPQNADIFLNNIFKGTSPVDLEDIKPGTYTVKARLEGYDTKTEKVRINANRKAVVTFSFEKKKIKGKLYVTTDPSDSIVKILNIKPKYRDGILLEKGSYKVQVSKSDYTTKTKIVQITSAEGVDLYVALEKKPVAAVNPVSEDTWTDPVTGMEFVWVKKGCYQMGQSQADKQYLIKDAGKETYEKYYKDELPRHQVCVDGFWMAKHEVTNRQYRKYKSSHDSKDYKGVNLNGDDQPVVYVSWDDAKAFAKWLSSKTGKQITLPSEVQWEYAARAGTDTIRFWGDDPDDACRYANVHDRTSKNQFSNFTWTNHNCNDGYAATSPVGSFQANNFGLYDMLGNVWEWCEDVYDKEAYSKHSRNNPLVLSGGSFRVNRGGCCYDRPSYVRSANRSRNSASFTYSFLGFRLIRKN
jgi:formylglycine-generating enzyme required for sulfatase activity